MVQHVGNDFPHPFRRLQRFLLVDGFHLLVLHILLCMDGIDVIDTERQDIFIPDRIYDDIGVETVPEDLLGSRKPGIAVEEGIGRENRRPCEAEDVVFFEMLHNGCMHIAELASVTFVENHDHMFLINLMVRILLDESIQFLDGGDDDFRLRVGELLREDSCISISIGRSLLETVVLLDRLVVQVFPVHYEKDFIDIGKLRGQLGSLEGREGLAGARGVPDVAAACSSSVFLVIVGNFDAVQDRLCRCNLVGPHHHQHLLTGEDTVPGQDVQEGVLGEEGLGEVQKVRDDLVVAVCPEGGELKGVGCPLGLVPASQFLFFQVVRPGGVGVVLGVGSIGDDKHLHILI